MASSISSIGQGVATIMKKVAFTPRVAPTPASRRFWLVAWALAGGIFNGLAFWAINVRTPSGDQQWLVICCLGRPYFWIPKTDYVPTNYPAQALIMIGGSLFSAFCAYCITISPLRYCVIRVWRWLLLVMGGFYGAMVGTLVSRFAGLNEVAVGQMAGALALTTALYFLPEEIVHEDSETVSPER